MTLGRVGTNSQAPVPGSGKDEIDPTELNLRQVTILDAVRAQGFATLEALARELAVSTQTIRREVIRLAEAKLLQRFHGGAGLSETAVRLGYVQKQSIAAAGKERIGRAAAALVANGSAIYLDVGTTAEATALALRNKKGIRVFTNSLPAASALADRDAIEVFVTGGTVRGADGSLVGDAVLACLEHIKVDIAFIGCSGIDGRADVMDFDLQKVAIKRVAMVNSRKAVLLADHTKFGRPAVARIADARSFATLVTDKTPPKDLRAKLRKWRLQIVVAE